MPTAGQPRSHRFEPLPRWHVIHWDAWTRRHQARSRWFHNRARLARHVKIALVSWQNAAAVRCPYTGNNRRELVSWL